MTTHLTDGNKRDKMITFLITKPAYSEMIKVVKDERHEDLRNMSDLLRISVEKEVKRRKGE